MSLEKPNERSGGEQGAEGDTPRIDAALEWASKHPKRAAVLVTLAAVALDPLISYAQSRGWLPMS